MLSTIAADGHHRAWVGAYTGLMATKSDLTSACLRPGVGRSRESTTLNGAPVLSMMRPCWVVIASNCSFVRLVGDDEEAG